MICFVCCFILIGFTTSAEKRLKLIYTNSSTSFSGPAATLLQKIPNTHLSSIVTTLTSHQRPRPQPSIPDPSSYPQHASPWTSFIEHSPWPDSASLSMHPGTQNVHQAPLSATLLDQAVTPLAFSSFQSAAHIYSQKLSRPSSAKAGEWENERSPQCQLLPSPNEKCHLFPLLFFFWKIGRRLWLRKSLAFGPVTFIHW